MYTRQKPYEPVRAPDQQACACLVRLGECAPSRKILGQPQRLSRRRPEEARTP